MCETMTMGQFLRHRRGTLTPEQMGLVDYGVRRVPGLRREEVAMLAGVSVTYYTRLEQGADINASEGVINALSKALDLNEIEARHLRDLSAGARKTSRLSTPAPSPPDFARDGTVRLIENMREVPCVLLGKCTELLAWNHRGHKLVAGHLDFDVAAAPDRRPNMTRLLFLDRPTVALYPLWRAEALRAVASLRLLSGRFVSDPQLARLISELSSESAEFATMWAAHPVENCMSGVKVMKHPTLGDLELDFEVLSMPDDSGHRLLTYTAATDSSAGRALQTLPLGPE